MVNAAILPTENMSFEVQLRFVLTLVRDGIDHLAINNKSTQGHTCLPSLSIAACVVMLFIARSAPLNRKTRLCSKYHFFGVCPYAERCNFAHGMHELMPCAYNPNEYG